MTDLHENERQSLIQKLLDSVKQCQATFGANKGLLATENDSSVACVIVHFEQVLLHGLKRSKVWDKITSISEPFRQVTQKMLPEIEITYWSLLKEYLGALDVQHFQTLDGISTDAGRARVWLRTALNESTLENHLNSILGHKTLRSQFYEPWALMMDEERASTIPTMARGLGSILFAIDSKRTELNQPFKNVYAKNLLEQDFKTHRRIKSNPLPVMAERDSTIAKTVDKRKKKKRRVIEATISDMNDSYQPPALTSYSASDLSEVKENSELYYSSTPDLTVVAMAEPPNKNLDSELSGVTKQSIVYDGDKTSSSIYYRDNDSSVQDIIMDSVEPSIYPIDTDNECILAQLESLKITPERKISELSSVVDDNSQVAENPTSDVSDALSISNSSETSIVNENLLDNMNSSPNMSGSMSDSVDNYMQNNIADDTLQDECKVLNTSVDVKLVNESTPRNVKNCYQEGNESSKYLQILAFDQESSQAASDTLALLSASNSNSMFQLEPVPDNESTSSRSEIEKYIPKLVSRSTGNCTNQTTLSSEELKKAILATAKKKDEIEEKGRVLQQAFDEQQEELNSLRLDYETLKNKFHEKENESEKKEKEMTQEIDFLKKQLKKYVTSVQLLGKDKDLGDIEEEIKNDTSVPRERLSSVVDESVFVVRLAQMAQMHAELLEFQETLQKQLMAKNNEIVLMKEHLVLLRGPLPDEDSLPSSPDSAYSPSRMLINIWIPSVFLKTKGTESYHLYQVYVHVGNDEWNIYRRYSQFSKLHTEVCKSHPSFETYNFPKKKMFGKKDQKLVEKRRHEFQEYLRKVINSLIANKSIIPSNANRRKLIELLPFFGEDFDDENERKWRSSKKKNNKNSTNTPQYSGL